MKAFKAFIKPFKAPQTSVKIKILVIFFSSSGIGTGKGNNKDFYRRFVEPQVNVYYGAHF